MLPSIFSALTRIANQTDPLKLALSGISYKPFISLFYLTEATKANPEVGGIGALLPSTHPTTIFWLMIRFQKTTTLWRPSSFITLHRESLPCG
jgi:hypothetical protein